MVPSELQITEIHYIENVPQSTSNVVISGWFFCLFDLFVSVSKAS